MRLHEGCGTRTRSRLRLGVDVATVTEVDLLEDPVVDPTQALPAGALAAGDVLDLDLHPFQLLTLRLRPRS